MAFLLSIETSTEVCSVALHENTNLICTSEFHVEHSHAAKLAVLVDQILIVAGLKTDQLKAVAISSGPGSYTGLRIGTSLAKGLCFSLNIPLISVGTLELMAYQIMTANSLDAILCPMIDARRMEVYCLLMNSDANIAKQATAMVIDEESFSDLLINHKIIFFGNGSSKCKNVLRHENAVYVDGIYPRASSLGAIAFKRWEKSQFEDVEHFEPFYLKGFVAKKPKTLI
jgi:tRNA threonylcarbamoyladenosine biosynthesis protein TsaB